MVSSRVTTSTRPSAWRSAPTACRCEPPSRRSRARPPPRSPPDRLSGQMDVGTVVAGVVAREPRASRARSRSSRTATTTSPSCRPACSRTPAPRRRSGSRARRGRQVHHRDRARRRARADGRRVAVLAVDPTSPYTGGACSATGPDAGARDRSGRVHPLDGDARPLGGMSLAAPEAVRILDAAGFDLVSRRDRRRGPGRDRRRRRDRYRVVVLAPGLGDAIQMAKAGILEVADVFVVNKADRDGAPRSCAELRQMLHLGAARPWDPPILATRQRTRAGSASCGRQSSGTGRGCARPARSRRSGDARSSQRGRPWRRHGSGRRSPARSPPTTRSRERSATAARPVRRRRGADPPDRSRVAWTRRTWSAPTDAPRHPIRCAGRAGLRPGPADARRAARRVPVHSRPVRLDVSRAPVDDAPVRRLRHARRDERAVPTAARARADGVVGRVRHADADGARPRRSTERRRGGPVRRRGRLASTTPTRCSRGSRWTRSRSR